jgi:GT2 family glycosyltransferase
VVVVDAGSRDDTAARAASHGARVVVMPEPTGPARARNAGVAELTTDVVLFLDADCVPRSDVVSRVRDAFAADPGLVSLTGSYTVDTPARSFASRYMNLRHHHTHQCARRQPATFWTGCGAVRRDTFLAVGGFDAERFPNGMEDMELGLRLAARGTTRLDPELQATHLKRWTLRSVIETDIRRRAIPWARLIFERGHLPNDLNARTSQRLATLVAPLALAAPVVLPAAVAMGAWLVAALAFASLVISLALNAPLLRLFAARFGMGFALAGWLFHQLHLVYSAVTVAICTLSWSVRGLLPRPRASGSGATAGR